MRRSSRSARPLGSGAIKVRAPAVGQIAAHLDWLAPRAASLVALARRSAVSVWNDLRADPGFVLLALRQPSLHADDSPESFVSRLDDSWLLQTAVRHLDIPIGFADWSEPPLLPMFQAFRTTAVIARHLAERTGARDSSCAEVAGFLSGLGWLAVAAADAAAVDGVLGGAGDIEALQRERWGLDAL